MIGLLAAARACSDVVDKRSPIDAMRMTRLTSDGEHLALSATDMTTEVAGSVPFSGKKWSCGVEAVALASALKSLPDGEVAVSFERMCLKLSTGSAKLSLPCVPDKDMPAIKPVDLSGLHEIDAATLRAAMGRVSYCIDASVGAPVHRAGLVIEGDGSMLALAGVHNHRIAECKIPFAAPAFAANVPHLGAARIAGLLGTTETARIGMDADRFICAVGDTVVSVRSIGGARSPYELVISGVVIPAVNVVRFNREAMLDAVGLASLMSDRDQDAKVKDGFRISFDGATATVTNENPLRGDASAEVTLTHPAEVPVKFSFSWRYLVDAIGRIETDEVEFRYKDALSPVVVRPVGVENQVHIVCPRD